jgi:hypothetical protein
MLIGIHSLSDGFLFDLDQGSICRYIKKIEDLIMQCVSIPQKSYSITKKRLKTPEELEKYFPGKKKRHTIKTQLMVNNQVIVIHKLRYKKGRMHDYDIYKRNNPVTPKDVVNVFDLGYLLQKRTFQNKKSSIPTQTNEIRINYCEKK